MMRFRETISGNTAHARFGQMGDFDDNKRAAS